MKILAIGPYIGDFENEILQFRPYARWLSEAIVWDKIYLSTHINRIFLYDFVPEENIIPIYQQFTRDEENQKGYVHKKINKRDFRLLLRTFKERIIEKENCNRKDIEIYNLSYSKNSPYVFTHNKIFEKIPNIIENKEKDCENKIIFIPAKQERIEKLSYVYKWLTSCYNDVIVVGNTDTWFSNNNIVLNKIDYFENGFKYIINYISKASVVITPLSYWTAICNLQNKKVFSWGKNPGQYREDGIYNFRNKNCYIIPSDNKTNPDIIVKCMKFFLDININ